MKAPRLLLLAPALPIVVGVAITAVVDLSADGVVRLWLGVAAVAAGLLAAGIWAGRRG